MAGQGGGSLLLGFGVGALLCALIYVMINAMRKNNTSSPSPTSTSSSSAEQPGQSTYCFDKCVYNNGIPAVLNVVPGQGFANSGNYYFQCIVPNAPANTTQPVCGPTDVANGPGPYTFNPNVNLAGTFNPDCQNSMFCAIGYVNAMNKIPESTGWSSLLAENAPPSAEPLYQAGYSNAMT